MDNERPYSYGRPNLAPRSEPHQDCQRNYLYCIDLLNKIEILEPTLYYQIYDFRNEGHDDEGNPIRIVTDPKFILFCWEDHGEKLTGVRSLHMEHDEFRKQFVDAINFFLQRRFVKRKGIPVGVKRSTGSAFPATPGKSYDDLFSNR